MPAQQHMVPFSTATMPAPSREAGASTHRYVNQTASLSATGVSLPTASARLTDTQKPTKRIQ